jgi:hypothetical protein
MSAHTIHSCRDSVVLFLRFLAFQRKRRVHDLDLTDIEPDHAIAFLTMAPKKLPNITWKPTPADTSGLRGSRASCLEATHNAPQYSGKPALCSSIWKPMRRPRFHRDKKSRPICTPQ